MIGLLASRRGLSAAWVGFTLAALFLYPLAGALTDGAFYLQWQRQDAIGALAALALLWLPLAGLVFLVWEKAGRAATLALLAIAALPLASFIAELLQQLPNDGALIRAWENPAIRLGVPAACLALIALAVTARPAGFGRLVRTGLLAMSPMAVLIASTLAASVFYPHPVVARADAAAAATGTSTCSSVIALLFDELSFAYVYDNEEVSARYPALRQLAGTATQYLHATAPGHETLVSLPGYLAVRRFDDVKVEGGRLVQFDGSGAAAAFSARRPDALFAAARRLGFHTEMAGYYLPYCDLLGDLVDTCRSLSFYNVARLNDSFSPADAIRTTLVLWPRQFPFGLLKNPPFARLQRGLVDATAAFAQRALPAGPPVFRFVHFSIPHLPFVFTPDGFAPPANPLRTEPDEAYVAQIGYVDRLVGALVTRLKAAGAFDRSTLIVFSDHGFRFGGRDTNPDHIPFIVKRAGQRARRDVLEAVAGEEVLRNELTAACTP